MDRTQKPKRNTTFTRQAGSDNINRNIKKRKRIKVLSGSKILPVKVYRKPGSTNRFTKKVAKKHKWIWPNEHTKTQKSDNTVTKFSTLQLKK